MRSKPKILIAVLSFNEAVNIEATLNDLQKNNFGYDIVVIDDGSNDETAVISKKKVFRWSVTVLIAAITAMPR